MEKKKNSKGQEMAKEYVQRHNIESIISDMLNSLIHVQSKEPIIYMIKYLSSLATEEELKNAKITIEGPFPEKVPMLKYPTFPENCESLLKKYLDKSKWNMLKKKTTKFGGNLQLCIKAGAELFNTPIGVYLTDQEAINIYHDLMRPILKEINKTDLSSTPKHSFSMDTSIITKQKKELILIKATAYCNISNFPFVLAMKKENKLQVERQLVDLFSDMSDDISGDYYQIKKIDQNLEDWLNSFGIKLEPSELQTKAGIADDWPIGRGIFIDKNRNYAILINFEEHITVISIGKHVEIAEVVERLFRIMQFIEKKVELAKDLTYGYLTSNLVHLGNAFEIECAFKLEHATSDKSVKIQLQHQFNVEIDTTDHRYTIIMKPSLVHTIQTSLTNYMKVLNKIIDSDDAMQQSIDNELKKNKEEEERIKQHNKEMENMKEEWKMDDVAKQTLRLKVVSNEIMSKFMDIKTSLNHSLDDCIDTNLEKDGYIGITAADEECYVLYEEVYDKILQNLHDDFDKRMKFDHDGLDSDKFDDVNFDFIEHFHIRLDRNIKGYAFTPVAPEIQKEEIQNKLVDIFTCIEDFTNYKKSIDSDDQIAKLWNYKYLYTSNEIKSWVPLENNNGLILNKSQDTIICYNYENHMTIFVRGTDIQSVYDQVKYYEEKAQALNYAKNEDKGNLLTSPKIGGTGFTIELHLKSNLNNMVEKYKSLEESKNFIIELIDNVPVIRNKYYYSITESDYIKQLIILLNKINNYGLANEGESNNRIDRIKEITHNNKFDYYVYENEQDLFTNQEIYHDDFNKLYQLEIKNAQHKNNFNDISKVNFNSMKNCDIKIKIIRNLNEFKMLPFLNNEELMKVMNIITKALEDINEQGEKISFSDDDIKKLRNEYKLLDSEINKEKIGMHSNWPENRSISISNNVLFLINFENHLEIYTITNSENFKNKLIELYEVVNKLDSILHFNHSSKLGYLTTNLSDIGNGLNLSTIITSNNEIKQSDKWDSYDIKNIDGDLIEIRLRSYLGKSEVEYTNKFVEDINNNF